MSSYSPVNRPYYDEKMNMLSAASAPQGAVRLLSANDMYAACDAFLDQTTNYESERLLPSKSCRNEIARRFQWAVEAKWIPPEEWTGAVQTALSNVLQPIPHTRIQGFPEWVTEGSLESDIHIAVRATLQTVKLFAPGDLRFVPAQTDIFLVPSHFGEFLASLVAGNVNPMWLAQVDSADTPGCRDGQYPIYSHRTTSS
ncbi:hypothetical protein Q3V30_04215 [Erwinia pyri]|uniref:Uncharacterized protein n=1 Tax=Erwinia pyri TaxID=3062598 RepID=A0AA50DKP2_9GAMM|nr:hypothetical protein [Erwinia sp. DE2]WLS79721.1 hypothetical protein Q3V30_04215 [Erwinia sp. DE2]